MTPDISIPVVGAFWLGLMTAISPCPLATNIAAVSYIGRNLSETDSVLRCGLAYVLGRMLVYVALGFLLVKSLVSAPGVSFFLQRHGNQVLGPLLVLVGLFLLRVIRLDFLSFSAGDGFKARGRGVWPAFLMGAVFALSFCPVSAALFFGGLVPLASREASPVLLPSLFGLGTGLPVAAFAVMAALGLRSAGRFYDGMARLEKAARLATGIVFVLAGIWLCGKYVIPVF